MIQSKQCSYITKSIENSFIITLIRMETIIPFSCYNTVAAKASHLPSWVVCIPVRFFPIADRQKQVNIPPCSWKQANYHFLITYLFSHPYASNVGFLGRMHLVLQVVFHCFRKDFSAEISLFCIFLSWLAYQKLKKKCMYLATFKAIKFFREDFSILVFFLWCNLSVIVLLEAGTLSANTRLPSSPSLLYGTYA